MNIIITGASRGIAYQTVLKLLQNTDNQLISISRNKVGLAQLQEEATSLGFADRLFIFEGDITEENPSFIKAIQSQFDQIDILINNAALLVNLPFEKTNLVEWRKIFEINIFGVVKITQAFLPLMGKNLNQKSHIVNIGSMGGFQGSSKFAGLSAYSSSKAALANLTECLAEELKERNIAVNCLALGAVQTEMLKEAFPDYQAPTSSQEMAKFIANFSTKGHQYQNGKIIPISISTP
jgi:short-subunit dehydrogenase